MENLTMAGRGAAAAAFPRAWVLLDHAIHIASGAHHKQTDKGGEPYLWHVLRVGVSLLPDIDAAAVGVLHDVKEDGGNYWARQVELSMPEHIVDAVTLLSHLDGDEDYIAYIKRIGENPLATKVKMADIEDNLRPERLQQMINAGIEADVVDKLVARYRQARYELETCISVRNSGNRVGRDG